MELNNGNFAKEVKDYSDDLKPINHQVLAKMQKQKHFKNEEIKTNL